MAKIISYDEHILERISERYSKQDSGIILSRIVEALETQAPDDWRFTESYSARFFVVDFKSKVKVLGITYRSCGQDILDHLQKTIETDHVPYLIANKTKELKSLTERYTDCLVDPGAEVVQQLRTAYPKQGGEIGEDKTILLNSITSVSHVVPMKVKKLAARPNAIVMGGKELWVRQHLNWVDMKKHDTEYLFFERLRKEGIDKSEKRIYLYDTKGNIEIVSTSSCRKAPDEDLAPLDRSFLGNNYRTETYWVLPTCVDLRVMDLDFRERNPDKTPEGPLSRDEMVELYFLRRILYEAQNTFLGNADSILRRVLDEAQRRYL